MRIMAGIGLAAIGLVAAQSAFAADLPTKAPPPMATATPWTGLYVNGGIGYALWAADETVGGAPLTQVQGGKGWLATIGLGYDYQFTQRIVAGIFGDFDIANLEGTIQDGQPFRAGQIKEKSSWAVGVRAGWVVGPKTLSYINGGYTGARFSGSDLVSSINGASIGLSTQAFTTNGWFLGGGVEVALFPSWFWRTEYRYSYYNSRDLPELTAGGFAVNTFTFKPTVQAVTTQLVYKFNGGLPTPAYPPIAEAATNWTGPYINAGYGYGLWAAQENSVGPATGLCTICVTQTQGGKGYLGTIGAGFDWQFAPMWVVGVFGDYNFSSLKGTLQDTHAFGFSQAIAGDIKQRSAWAVGPRFGWLMSPQTLTYVNGGFTSARFSGRDDVQYRNPHCYRKFDPGLHYQWLVRRWRRGNRLQLLRHAAERVFLRSEYRYASYENKTLPDTGAVTFASINFKPVVQTITSSIMFKLN